MEKLRIPHKKWGYEVSESVSTANRFEQNMVAIEQWSRRLAMDPFGGFEDGTEALPGAFWVDDTDTGFFRYADNSISLSLGGDERVRFASNGQILPADVTGAGRPVYSFLEDDTTGFQTLSPGALIQVVVDGDVCWEFDGPDFLCHPGNIGQIYADNGSASAPGYTFNSDANGNSGFWQPAENEVGVCCAGAEVARWSSSGLTIADGKNVILNTTTGTKIGTATTQKLGFWNATPATQSTGWSMSNVTTDKVLDADATTLDEVADVLGTLIDTLKTYGLLGA